MHQKIKYVIIIAGIALASLVAFAYYCSAWINPKIGRSVGFAFIHFVERNECAKAYVVTSREFRNNTSYLSFCSSIYRLHRVSDGNPGMRAVKEIFHDKLVVFGKDSISTAWNAESLVSFANGVRVVEEIQVVYEHGDYYINSYSNFQIESEKTPYARPNFNPSALELRIISKTNAVFAGMEQSSIYNGLELVRMRAEGVPDEVRQYNQKLVASLLSGNIVAGPFNERVNPRVARLYEIQWDNVLLIGAAEINAEYFDWVSYIVLQKKNNGGYQEKISLVQYFQNDKIVNVAVIPGDLSGENAFFIKALD